ncbi:hypothetical protein ACW9KT_04655 [Hymenobacter sp. HD11105]
MTIRLLSVLASLSLLICPPLSAPAGNQEQLYAVPNDSSFFSKQELVELTLTLPLDKILADRGDAPVFHSALLTYRDSSATPKTMDVQVKVRGNRRKDPAVCRFPPLLVKFPPQLVESSIFGKVDELKLTTHCLEDTYTLREYLVYKLYNILTDKSFRARLCRITYQDTRRKGKAMVYYAFFLEDAKAMALRSQATIVPKPFFIGMQHMEPKAMATMAVFQYMIGNTDWSVPYRHNTRMLMLNQQAKPIPVPYDFDYSGLVMAPYAVPPAQLGITSVRERLFRGYSFTPEMYDDVRNLFNSRRGDMYKVYLLCPYLTQQEKVFATKYLEEFYMVLNDPKDFQRHIVRIGQKNDKTYTNVKGLK